MVAKCELYVVTAGPSGNSGHMFVVVVRRLQHDIISSVFLLAMETRNHRWIPVVLTKKQKENHCMSAGTSTAFNTRGNIMVVLG